MTVTLINCFEVPPEREDEFLTAWRSTIGHFTSAPGFVSAGLHRNTGLNDATFRFVNVALWESVEAYRAVFEGFTPAGRRIPGVKAYPGLFEVAVSLTAADG